MINYKDKRIFIFDVDNTIADSYGPVHKNNAKIICNLLKVGKIVIFATDRSRNLIEEKVLALLPCDKKYFSQIHLLPAGGAAMYSWKEKDWVEIFAERMDSAQENTIVKMYKKALTTVDKNLLDTEPSILNKNSLMLSCSALLPTASKQERLHWDPDQSKRKKIIQLIQNKLRGFDIGIGGSATINITMPQVNKAYGVEKLFKILDLSKRDSIFVGDAIYPGGNDYCMLETNIDTIPVENPDDTVNKLQMFLD